MRKSISFLILTIVFCFNVLASSHVKWSYSVKRTTATEAEINLTATIDDGFHFYAMQSDPTVEFGPNKLEFTFTKSNNYNLIGKMVEPKPIQEYEKMFECNTYFFTKKVVFKQKIKINNTDKDFIIKLNAYGQTCNVGSCSMEDDDIEIKIEKWKGEKESSEESAAKEEINEVTDSEDSVTTVAKEEVNTTSKTVITQSEEKETEEESLLWFFLTSIGGGLIGLLMPCVFPMIPMTVSFFTKQGAKGKFYALVYGISIVAIFVIIGILFSVVFGAGAANELATGWILNVIFAVIFIIFALSMFGYFEITLPSSWVNKSAKNERKGGLIGVFFMALTLVLVSFSCTLPIAGAVALNAAGGSFAKPILGMLGFSLGIAVPFTLFALFPGFLTKRPKSGSWMNTLKVILAFIELAFALKFINVPDQTYHWGILDREVYLAFWIVLFTMLGFYLIGKLRFPADPEMPVQHSALRFSTAIFVFAFVIYMIPGMFGAPLNAISGWLPPVETHDFDLHQVIREETKEYDYAVTETPHYADKLELPHGIQGYFDYNQALRVAQKVHKPIFIDFTGHGCTNCRQVEAKVWRDEKVREKFATDFIVTALYVDDKNIELLPEDRIKDDNGEEIRLLGKKNMYISQKIYKENSQPCYLILDEDGTVLAGPTYYELDVEKYMQLLNKGVNAYNERHGK